ncbi:hypothetical protein A5744_06090 [Mycobacterium sp. IS-1264]|nr:hypothetical protein A5744_06090 [Mycobacterium sp. IS-1264]
MLVAYGLVLLGCALFYRARASSRAGRGIAAFVIAAVVIAVLANGIEDLLLWITPAQHGIGWRTAEAAATIKFCMIAVGAVGVLASLGIVLRDLMAWYRRLSIWHSCKGVSIPQMLRSVKLFRWIKTDAEAEPLPAPWWDDVLAPNDLPKPTETQEAVKKAVADSGQTAEAVIENQQRWLHSYSVPGVTDALKNRTEPLRALCLSGGGVRSACVAMGAMQVFSKPSSATDAVAKPSGNGSSAATLLDGLDYVISVSGGGYAAGARLLAVQDKQVDPQQKRTEKRKRNKQPEQGDKPQPPLPNVVPISKRFEEGSAEFDHIRSRSSYIADSPVGLLRALVEVLKNLVASLATIFTVPVIAGSALGWLLARIPIAAFPPVPDGRAAIDPNNGKYFPSLITHSAAYWALGFFALWAVAFTLYALFEEWKSSSRSSEDRQLLALRLARASAGFALVVFTLTIALPGLMRLCSGVSGQAPSTGGAFAALSGVVGLNYVAALIAMIWRDKNKLIKSAGMQTSPGLLKRILPPQVISLLLTVATFAVLLVVWLALLGSFAAGAFHYCARNGLGEHLAHLPPGIWWLGGVALTWLFIGFADVTSLSLHPFYRRRLAHTFAVRRAPDKGAPNEAVRYRDDEPTWLHWYGRTTNGPQFVFACAATITGPDRPAPGLNAVSYVMSADYIGGPALGWFHTEKLFEAAPPRIRRDLTVEAAVAVSGAAFASAMGRQNKGIEKLLAVSGARLGTWLPNPSFVTQLRDAEHRNDSGLDCLPRGWPKSLPTIRGGGYLYREILGINNIDARLVQITDGGHYDNSGLVEALRRRCGLIFVIDGGGDPPPLPIGLTDAIRLAKYELGVEITLNETGPYSVENITPGSGKHFAKDDALANLNSRITRGAVVKGDITYPAAAGLEKSAGILIFAKAVLCEACPYWLLTYAASSDIFPHDPTSDQWFSEGQFAAYTELGRVIADEAVKCAASLQPTSSGARRRTVSVP